MNRFFSPLLILPLLLSSGCNSSKYTNAEDYLILLNECRNNGDFHSELYVFPDSIEGTEINKFMYQATEDLFNGSYLFYLALQYNEETFNVELERLSSVKAVFPRYEKEKTIIHFEDKSLYLSIDRNSCYEYVIYNKESFEIAYISNQLYQWKDIPIIEDEYKLRDITIPSEYDDGKNSYNMYYYYLSNGDGYYVED